MAQTLSKTDSPVKVKRTVRRHLRLARRSADEKAIAIANRLVAPLEALEKAIQKAALLVEAAEDAFDDWHQDAQRLDQAVRRIHLRCLDWDAVHPADRTAPLVFGGMAPSAITSAPRHKEPDLVAKMVVRGRELPPEHPVAPLLGTLQALADASRKGHVAWTAAEQRVAEANTAVEMAKLVVVRVYRDNLIDIERASGSSVAEGCFPILRRSRRVVEEEPLDTAVEDEA